MRNNFFLILIIFSSLFLISCQAIDDINFTDEDAENNFIELTDATAHKIVWENLDRIEMVLTEYFDEAIMYADESIITEDILDETKDTEEIEDFLRPYRGAFQALMSEDQLELLMREYVYVDYTSMHNRHLSRQNMHIRFQIKEQSAEQFEASFIQLADEAYNPVPVQYTVTYVKAYNEWLLHDYEMESLEGESLELTVHDIKDYYHNIHQSEAELIDSLDDYLVFRITPSKKAPDQERYFVAINIHDSLNDYDLAAEYE